MKKKLLVSLTVGTLMLASMGFGAYAATNLEEIKANLNKGISFVVNGKPWVPKDQSGNVQYAITYKGSTYVPLRAAGDALGVEVGWDGKNNRIYLGEGAAAVEGGTSTTPASNIGFSRSNPAPIGKTVTYSIDDFIDKYTAEIKLEEVIRGEEAWKIIEAANSFNSKAPEGHEYLLARINFKVVSNKKEDATVSLSPVNFTLVSTSGKDYDFPMVVVPDPELRANLYAGASNNGWAAFIVKTDDKDPLLAFGRDYDGTKGVWLKP